MQSESVILNKPPWLDKKINLKQCDALKHLFEGFQLHTVCQQALCPNIAECFEKKVATFLILGNVCTRRCSFCAVRKGIPAPLDKEEPRRLARATEKLALRHVVITSVTRDDLPDGGAGAFAETIATIRSIKADTAIEVLVPDFRGENAAIEKVIAARPQVFGHNVETVPRLYASAREGADYRRSLYVLAHAKKMNNDVLTKSGIMLGLGERAGEICDVFGDLRQQGCDFLSIGQYLAPSRSHYPVKEYVEPEQFAWYRKEALRRGFRSVESGPYVRSSYVASDYMQSVI